MFSMTNNNIQKGTKQIDFNHSEMSFSIIDYTSNIFLISENSPII